MADIQEPQVPVEGEVPLEDKFMLGDKDISDAFTNLLRFAQDEDRPVRDQYLRLWKRLEYYWNNILDIFMDPVTGDWRIPDWDALSAEGETPPRLINIYRPHGEAIVAALSVSIPSVIFHPDDADSPEDQEASKAYRAIVDLLALHNNSSINFIKAIVIMFNQGTVFGYNYYHKDFKFGKSEKPKVEMADVQINEHKCPECGALLDSTVDSGEESYGCPECGYVGSGEVSQTTERLPQIVGFTKDPKGSIRQELFSGEKVKVSAYAVSQEQCGYLLLNFYQSTSLLRSIFKDNAQLIDGKQYDNLQNFRNLPPQYFGEVPDNASLVDCLWVRPWQFYQLMGTDTDLVDALLEKFPTGAYAIFVNNVFMEAHEEDMDEHWTISENPLGTGIYANPLGEMLSTVQDIKAQMMEIEIQTAEFGISETFVDQKVLDLNKYGSGRSQPGMMTGVQARPGKGIGESFFQSKPAVLSQEIAPLENRLDELGQFVSGSFPSIYGGTAIGGSKTASEYAQSKAMALQRVGTIWKILCSFWSKFQARSAVEYANALKAAGKDERFTQKSENGGFVNVWIRRTSLTGKVGQCEPEASEQLPVSWAQKKDAIFQLIQSGSMEIMSVLTHPNNAGLMRRAIGLSEVYIPGEEDRTRQLKEFSLLSQGVQVPVNQYVDNHAIHIEVLKSLLEGPLSDELEEAAKELCMMHLQEHMMAEMALNAAQAGPEGPESAPENEPKENENVPS